MNGYSKISTGGSGTSGHKSRSIDFSDFFSFPQTPKPNSRRNSAPGGPTTHAAKPEEEEEKEEERDEVKRTRRDQNCSPDEGVRFGVILGRSSSVSSVSGIQATMKRAFSISMRRSSSVSERYCRIHDQYMAISSPPSIDEDVVIGSAMTVKKNKKQRGGKILKACKRLLGFQ